MNPLILRLAVALAIGLLVGVERGWQERDHRPGGRTAGIRTYGITGLLGGVCAAVAQAMDTPATYYVSFAVFSLIFAWFKWREEVSEGDFSVTGVVAALAVFALGGLAVAGDQIAAAAGGTALAGVLASREYLHAWLKRISWVELRAALLLAAMSVIVLPLLPDRALDPWGGFNPWEIWFFTVLVASISYAGYVAIKVFGPQKGILFSSLAGAVVSSTAITLSLGRMAASSEDGPGLAGAACLAALVSVVRVLAIILAINASILEAVALPLIGAGAIFALAGSLLFSFRAAQGELSQAPKNPFDLIPLLIFAATFAAVALASAYAQTRLGGSGAIAVSTVSGVLDVDAAILSVARLSGQEMPVQTAGLAIIGAFAANAAARTLIAFSAGSWRFAVPYALVSTAAVVTALSTALLYGPAIN